MGELTSLGNRTSARVNREISKSTELLSVSSSARRTTTACALVQVRELGRGYTTGSPCGANTRSRKGYVGGIEDHAARYRAKVPAAHARRNETVSATLSCRTSTMNGATPRGAPNFPPPIADATNYLNPLPVRCRQRIQVGLPARPDLKYPR